MSTARGRNKLMQALIDRYGQERAATVYAQMKARAQGPFGPGNELHDEHLAFARNAGVPPLTAPRRGTSPRGVVNRR